MTLYNVIQLSTGRIIRTFATEAQARHYSEAVNANSDERHQTTVTDALPTKRAERI